jgi:murein DD-endopeptidase MepM/ murein hydrolase activator NlpD
MKAPILLAVLALAAATAPLAAPPSSPAVGLTSHTAGLGDAEPAGRFSPVAAALAAAPAPSPAARSWAWPLAPRPVVLRAFDAPEKPWLSGHRGVDLQATADGGPVTSPESGTVSFVGIVVDRPVITVDHGNGLRSSFEPVRSGLKKGATVAKGDVLGALMTGHCGATACVHWGVRRGEDYVNPLGFVMDLRPSILLPLHEG